MMARIQGTPHTVRETRALLDRLRGRPSSRRSADDIGPAVKSLREKVTTRLGRIPRCFDDLTENERRELWSWSPSDREDFWAPAIAANRRSSVAATRDLVRSLRGGHRLEQVATPGGGWVERNIDLRTQQVVGEVRYDRDGRPV